MMQTYTLSCSGVLWISLKTALPPVRPKLFRVVSLSKSAPYTSLLMYIMTGFSSGAHCVGTNVVKMLRRFVAGVKLPMIRSPEKNQIAEITTRVQIRVSGIIIKL